MLVTLPESAYSLDQLAALVDLPKRTLRYYMQLGLVDRPIGETRAARYTQRHAEQLIAIRKWTASGLSLERIGELLKGAEAPAPARARGAGTVEVWSHLVVADGVEITLEPGRAGLTPEQVRALFGEVTRTYQEIRAGKPTNAGRRGYAKPRGMETRDAKARGSETRSAANKTRTEE